MSDKSVQSVRRSHFHVLHLQKIFSFKIGLKYSITTSKMQHSTIDRKTESGVTFFPRRVGDMTEVLLYSEKFLESMPFFLIYLAL